MNTEDIVVLSTENSKYLARNIAGILGTKIVQIEKGFFKDGEMSLRIMLDNPYELSERTAIVVASTDNIESLFELNAIMFGLKECGIKEMRIFLPFFGYSTMERATNPGEIVMAKMIALQLSSHPDASNNSFYILDPHTAGLKYYFEGACKVYELSAVPGFIQAIEKIGTDNVVVATADLSRSKVVDELAALWNAAIAMIRKFRNRDETRVVEMIGEVTGKKVLIYDDMTRTAGTSINAANTYIAHGATEVHLILSHFAPINHDIIRTLHESPIRSIIISNSHPMSDQIPAEFLSKYTRIDQGMNLATVLKKQLRIAE